MRGGPCWRGLRAAAARAGRHSIGTAPEQAETPLNSKTGRAGPICLDGGAVLCKSRVISSDTLTDTARLKPSSEFPVLQVFTSGIARAGARHGGVKASAW